MRRHVKLFFAAALACSAAHAQVVQTQIGVPPALDVQRLAPQLVAFAGSDVNFQNLVNGLNLGLPITLATPLGAGVTQVVTFTPTGTMSALQIAQVLETARQTAIANGIATPTAQQVAVILNGGALPTATGSRVVTGLIGSNAPVNTTLTSPPSVAATLQSTPRFNVSDNPVPRGVSDTSAPPVSTTPTPGTATPPAFVPGGAAGATAPAATGPRRWGTPR